MTPPRRIGPRRLTELTEAISEHRSIDWDAESETTPELSRTLASLQQLDALGQAHRAIAATFPDGTPPESVLFRWGHLDVLELVGEGGFGEVYRARDTRLQREVALKLRRAESNSLSSSNRAFLEEARNLARVRHGNVLVVYGADVHDTRAGFWTDFIRGRTLAARLDDEGPFDAGEAALVGMALCRALAAVHSAGLLHGDVKASNVMCEADGRILLMDFGSVSRRSVREEGEASGRGLDLSLEVAIGSPLLLAPEVLRGERPGPASDLYSLAVLLYQLVTGQFPVPAKTWEELVERHQAGDRIALRSIRSDLPEEFVRVVERALDPDPAARYVSASAMGLSLRLSMPSIRQTDDEAQTLRSLLDELGRFPEELCREIARETAKSLLRIHASGAVVGTLDLRCIRLRPDGGVELEGLKSGTGTSGAPADRPPRSQRDDLRELAATLFEIGTGRPHEGIDLLELRPTSPRQLSPFLGQVVRELSAPDGEGTLTSARDLLRVITDGEKGGWWHEHLRSMRRASRRVIGRMNVPRETEVRGRDEALRALRSSFDRAAAGHGRVVLLEGEAGIGKTRLVDSFIGHLEREQMDFQFLHGAYAPSDASAAAGAFLTAYRGYLGEDALEESVADFLSIMPLLVPPLVALLQGRSAAEDADPGGKELAQRALVQLALSISAERPTVVLIDDLHFAPAEGRGLFAALAQALPGHPLLLLGSVRPGVPVDWIANVGRLEHASHLKLPRLTTDQVREVLAEVLPSTELAEELAPELTRRSDGNPLFLLEHVRAVLPELDSAGRAPDSPRELLRSLGIPSSIQDLIQARFARLDDDDKELLEVACCAGFEFDPVLVGEALGSSALPVLRRFARIERRHSLIRSADRTYVFDHHEVQEALYRGLFAQLRESYHGCLAQALESRGGARVQDATEVDGSIAVQIAGHYLRSADGRGGLRYLDAALHHLEGTYQNEAVVDLCDLALKPDRLLTGAIRFSVLARKVQRLMMLGLREEEQTALRELVQLGEEIGEAKLRAQACYLLGDRYARDSRNDEARRLLEEALRLARDCGDLLEEAIALSALGKMHSGMGRHTEALEAFARSLELATGNPSREVTATGNIGAALASLRRYAEARSYFQRSLELAREIGHTSEEAVAIGHLGVIHFGLGEPEQGRRLFEQSRELARKLGHRRKEAFATLGLAATSHYQGRCADALAHAERASRLFRGMGIRVGEGSVAFVFGQTLGAVGAYEAARTRFEEALTISREVGHPMREADACFGLASVAQALEDFTTAACCYSEALALRRSVHDREGEAAMLLYLSDLRRKMEMREEAESLLREALEIATALGHFRVLVAAAARRAIDARSESQAALDLFALYASRLAHEERMEVLFHLWQATADRTHLDQAARALDELCAHAPVEYQQSMLERVPLHREIRAAVAALRAPA